MSGMFMVCDSQMFMVCEDVYGVDGVCDSGM